MFAMFKHPKTLAVFNKLMHEKIMTVDYTQDRRKKESQFVAELSFTILDW